MPVHELDDAELRRLYGPWAGRTPADAAVLFDGYPGRWWISGGWAIQAFTGVVREHGDLDPELPRPDLPLLRRHLTGRFDVWTPNDGVLVPLLPGDDPDAPADTVLPDGCSQVWTRPSGAEPWEFDILLMSVRDGEWRFKRDPRVRLPLDEVAWTRDGIAYVRPEIQLLHKARSLRAQDQADFDACLPLFDDAQHVWLREALTIAHPGHVWLDRL